MPKILENIKVLDSQAKNVKTKVQAMVSSVVIAYVFTKYQVFLKSEKCEILLKCLRLPADEEVCSEFVKTIKEFDEITLRYVISRCFLIYFVFIFRKCKTFSVLIIIKFYYIPIFKVLLFMCFIGGERIYRVRLRKLDCLPRISARGR